jgi:hypothetical protein
MVVPIDEAGGGLSDKEGGVDGAYLAMSDEEVSERWGLGV